MLVFLSLYFFFRNKNLRENYFTFLFYFGCEWSGDACLVKRSREGYREEKG